MSDQAGEKKFELSDKRRNTLRDQGSVARSTDVTTSVTLGVALVLLVTGGGAAIGYLREIMQRAFITAGNTSLALRPETIGSLFTSPIWLSLGLFLGAMAVAVFVTQVAQVGIGFADEALTLKLDKLNPLTGFKNIFSLNKLTQSGQNILKLVVVGSFTWMALKQIQTSPVFARPVNLHELGEAYTGIAWSLGTHIVMVLGALAAADFAWQKWKFNHDNRMTFEEVKEERRSQEMSPEVMKKRRQMGRKFSLRRQLENMKDATVVVVNPTHYAVALRYKKGETEAPVVIAKGIRGNALRIKERAYELHLAVKRDVPLAQGLYKYGRIGQPIPAIYYQAVAAILALLYRQGFRPGMADGFETRPSTPLGHGEDPEIWNTAND